MPQPSQFGSVLICYGTGSCQRLMASVLQSSRTPVNFKNGEFGSTSEGVVTVFFIRSGALIASYSFPAVSCVLNRHWMVVPSGSEEHTSELQSRQYLVCRLLLEKKK